jgi:hypothetical protein
MKSFLLSILPLLAFSLAAQAEPPITRYAALGWIGHYDVSGTRVTWAKADQMGTELKSVPCPYCAEGYVAGTSDFCGHCSGSRWLPCETVNVMPARELLAHKGCGCGPACDCVGCDCSTHAFVSEPAPQTVTVTPDQLQAMIDAAVEKALQKRFPVPPTPDYPPGQLPYLKATASAPTCANGTCSPASTVPATYYYSDQTAGTCASGSCGSTGRAGIFGGRFRRR